MTAGSTTTRGTGAGAGPGAGAAGSRPSTWPPSTLPPSTQPPSTQPSGSGPAGTLPAAARPAGTGPAGTRTGRRPLRVNRLRLQRITIVLAMFGLPLLRPGGPGNTGAVDVGLLLVLGATMAWAVWSRHKLRFPYVIPVGLMIMAGAVAALRNELGPSVLLTLGQDFYVLVWAAVLANLVSEAPLLRTATRGLGVTGTVWAGLMLIGVFAHISALSGVNVREGSRASLTLGDPNLAANYFLIALMVLRSTQYPRRRWLRWLFCTVIVLAIAFTGSNGGALTLVLATVLGAVMHQWRRRGAGVALALALVLGGSTAALASQINLSTVATWAQTSAPILRDSIGRQAESGGSRSSLASESLRLWYTDGLLGIGPGQTKPTLLARGYPYVKEAHDDYAAALVERGVLGGIGIVLLTGTLLVRGVRLATRPLRPEAARVVPRPELLLAALVGVLVSAMLYEVLHFRHIWALFGLVAGLEMWGTQTGRRFGRRGPIDRSGPDADPDADLGHDAGPGPDAAPVGSAPNVPTPAPAPALVPAPARAAEPDAAAGPVRVARGSVESATAWPVPLRSVTAGPAAVPAESSHAGPIRHAATSWPGTPTRRKRLGGFGGDRRTLIGNVGARIGALVALGLATVLVARTGGPSAVGLLALLRVLPGLAGVLVSCGLPSAVPYFLSSRRDATMRSTLIWLTVAGAALAALAWLVGSPILRLAFFRQQGLLLIASCAVAVFTQQFVAVGKALLQGGDDLSGANVAIVAEEAAFLPVYLALVPILSGSRLLIVALIGADVVVAGGIAIRLLRTGFFRGCTRPEFALGREITRYGLRGQVGGVLLLLNLRFDFALLGAISGPAVLGVYAVASKYAELLRLPGLAVTYVLYPRFTRQGPEVARSRTAALLPRTSLLMIGAAIPLLALAGTLLPALYGRQFGPAVLPAWILIVGLIGEGVVGLVSAYLYATGRPGMNSIAMGVGVLATVGLDLLLIPRHGAIGAAFASAAAYLLTASVLLGMFALLRNRPVPTATPDRAAASDRRPAGRTDAVGER